MMMTNEAMTLIELDAAIAPAPAPMLSHYIEVVRNGVQDAPADVAEHGRHLLLKLEHLLRQQQVEHIHAAAGQDYLAPWLRLAEPVRAAA
jgi:hypothetical protein